MTRIMESLAEASGDVEALVAVLSKDLSNPYNYLKIGEAYRDAGKYDDALLWAEKGLQAFPDRPDWRLREFVADEYHRRRRHDEAMKLIWADFAARPYLETYKKLENHARKAKAWPEWRERALAGFRRLIAQAKEGSAKRPTSHWLRSENDHSRLVEVFLHEGDIEAAWREAQEGGCSSGLWLSLAEAYAKDHPEDAAPIYLKQAEVAVAEVRGSRYDESVELLIKAAAAMQRLGRSADFVRNLDTLCVKYKIKRNFIKLVEENRKSLYLS